MNESIGKKIQLSYKKAAKRIKEIDIRLSLLRSKYKYEEQSRLRDRLLHEALGLKDEKKQLEEYTSKINLSLSGFFDMTSGELEKLCEEIGV